MNREIRDLWGWGIMVLIICTLAILAINLANANDFVPVEMGDFILEMKENIESNTSNECTNVRVTIEFDMVDEDSDYTIGYDYQLYPAPLDPSGRTQ